MVTETWIQLRSNLSRTQECREHVYFNATRKGVVVTVTAHGVKIECPKSFLLRRRPGIRGLILPVESSFDSVDVTAEFPNERIFKAVMTVAKGFRAVVANEDGQNVMDVLTRWMGDSAFVSQVTEHMPERTLISLRTDGQLLVKFLDENYNGPDRGIYIVAHGKEVKISKFVLSWRVPGLMPRVNPLTVPGGKLDVSDEVQDEEAFGMIMQIIKGDILHVDPPYDFIVRHVLQSWVHDPTTVVWSKVNVV